MPLWILVPPWAKQEVSVHKYSRDWTAAKADPLHSPWLRHPWILLTCWNLCCWFLKPWCNKPLASGTPSTSLVPMGFLMHVKWCAYVSVMMWTGWSCHVRCEQSPSEPMVWTGRCGGNVTERAVQSLSLVLLNLTPVLRNQDLISRRTCMPERERCAGEIPIHFYPKVCLPWAAFYMGCVIVQALAC